MPIVRPFLETDQAALHQCLTASGLQPVQDPSNSDNRFQRVLLRENRGFFDGLGLTAEILAATASRLQPARAVLQQLTQEALNQHLQVGACGQISFERAAFQALPQEIGIRFLRQIFSHHQDYAPRQARLEAIYKTICDHKQHKRQTLAGLMCDSQPHQVIIYREPAAIDPTPIIVKAGQTAVWDQRFVVKVSKKWRQMCASPRLGLRVHRLCEIKALNCRNCPLRFCMDCRVCGRKRRAKMPENGLQCRKFCRTLRLQLIYGRKTTKINHNSAM